MSDAEDETAEMVRFYVALRPIEDIEPGCRLRLEFPAEEIEELDELIGACAVLAQELTLPEKVLDPRARRVEREAHILLRRDDLVWLRAQLDELIAQMPTEPAEATP